MPYKIKVTCSFGVSQYNHDDAEDSTDNLIKRADLALYHAKETGRNKVVLYSDMID